MTSLILGIACIYLAVTVLRLPEERFRAEVDRLTGGREQRMGYYKLVRGLFWVLGALGAAMIVLRFFD